MRGVVQSVCGAAAMCEVAHARWVGGWFVGLLFRWGVIVGEVGWGGAGGHCVCEAAVAPAGPNGEPQQQEARLVLRVKDLCSLLPVLLFACLRPSFCLSVLPPACALSACALSACLCPRQAGRRHKRYKKSRRRLAALKGLVPLHGAAAAKLRKLGFKKKWWFSLKA